MAKDKPADRQIDDPATLPGASLAENLGSHEAAHGASHARSAPPAGSDSENSAAAAGATASPGTFVAPHPGSRRMPRWDTGELIEPPRFTWKNWFALLGPGLVMGGAAVGGGEWLLGPKVTAIYGGALLWLTTVSILAQVIYNIEISRYTLYTGEPIFTGKFRTLPGPAFWLAAYLFFDLGSIFPYLAANAATPLGTILKGGVVPNANVAGDKILLRTLSYVIFLAALVPLLFGGKIYNSLRRVMTFKLVVVFGFLLFLAFFFSQASTWVEIGTGFLKFGNIPVERGEDLNDNGYLDPREDWDRDGKLDIDVEPKLGNVALAVQSGQWPDLNRDGQPDPPLDTDGDGKYDTWGDLNRDGKPEAIQLDTSGRPSKWPDVIRDSQTGATDGRPDTFIDYDGDGRRDGPNVDNIFVALFQGRPLHGNMDFTLIAFITGLAAIAGSGGLTNTPISNYTRDQGWGMGHHVGAIPSIFGGHNIQLSHVGCVFKVTPEVLPRWKRWYKHVVRDQMAVWMPACFVGIALPAMLSVQFLPRGFESDDWTMSAMTAGKVGEHVAGVWGPLMGSFCWFMILFCGFLVLAPTMANSADGIIRRWVDVFWTSSGRLRQLDPKRIRQVYFGVLVGYMILGLIMLAFLDPAGLVKFATMFYNIALGFSCWHTLVLNCVLLPRELRPNWIVRVVMFLAGLFFLTLGTVTLAVEMPKLVAELQRVFGS
jgi:hypothetical protein